MSVHCPSIDTVTPLVADIVERNVHALTNQASAFPSPPIELPLRSIQAVVGQAFPVLKTRRSYGRRSVMWNDAADAFPSPEPSRAPLQHATQALDVLRYSAHVQPQGPHRTSADPCMASNEISGLSAIRASISVGSKVPVIAAGGSAQQRLPAHQWSASEFDQLQSGYYVEPVALCCSRTSAADAEGMMATRVTSEASRPSSCVKGEDFFLLLFQCVRSTVRKHQQIALEVLLAHLSGLAASTASSAPASMTESVALRDRCLHGPDCAPFLFFLLEILVSAGHPAIVELTATCLLLLLRGLSRGEPTAARGSAGASASRESVLGDCSAASRFVEALAELGSPAGDHPEEDTVEEGGDAGRNMGVGDSDVDVSEGDRDLLFSEVSELLRGPDARLGLEQLGLTNKVLGAMRLLLLSPNIPPMGVVPGGAGDGKGSDDAVGQECHGGVAPSTASSPSPSAVARCSTHAEFIFLELLLCGGVGVGRRATCQRVAEDPSFRTWVEAQLSAVVLGHRHLEDITELLCVLQHLSHIPSALRSLLSGVSTWGTHDSNSTSHPRGDVVMAAHQRTEQHFYETWLLFFILVCSTSAAEVRTVRHASSILWSMLILRSCARLGHQESSGYINDEMDGDGPGHAKRVMMHSSCGILQDISDTLLSEGLHIGGGVVMEMWFLQYTRGYGVASAAGRACTGHLDHYFLDAARTALQLCRSPAEDLLPVGANDHFGSGSHDAVTPEAEVAQRLLLEIRWAASAHFLSTYLTQVCHGAQKPVLYALCNTEVDTQAAVRFLMQSVVLNASQRSDFFARLTSPLLSRSWRRSADGLCPSNSGGAHRDKAHGVPALLVGAPLLPVAAAALHHTVESAIRTVMRHWLRDSSGNTEFVGGALEAESAVCDHSLFLLSCNAASLYARTRLCHALAEVYPAVALDMALGYALLIVHSFEEACLRLNESAAVRLQVDELCTMAVAVQLLERFGGSDSCSETTLRRSALSTADPLDDTALTPRCAREVRIGAFFLLHCVAVSKHCLDVVPSCLPLLLLRLPVGTTQRPKGGFAAITTGSIAVDDAQLEPLMHSLQSGIELTPIPVLLGSAKDADDVAASSTSEAVVSFSGAPRSWVLYPLFDDSFSAKHLWASWLRRLLGLHQRVKDVLRWDEILSHTLLWTLSHRRELWHDCGNAVCEVAEAGVSSSVLPLISATSLCELMVDLCTILHAQSSVSSEACCSANSDAVISAAASRSLEISLAAYSDAPSEDGLPLLVHALLAFTAAHCSARTALAALQLLLVTPVLHISCTIGAGQETHGESADEKRRDHSAAETTPGSRSTSVTTQVCSWLHSWTASQRWRMQSARSVCWSLDDIVALVQLVGPHLRDDSSSERRSSHKGYAKGEPIEVYPDPQEAVRTGSFVPEVAARDSMWCVRCLTEGFLQYYLQQRIATSGGLSVIEKMALRSTLEDLDWRPKVLWPHLENV